MNTLQLLAYALGSALPAALIVALVGGVAFGFWPLEWTREQAAAVGLTATIAGIVTANAFLRKLMRANRRRIAN
jgi:hypothetical protein